MFVNSEMGSLVPISDTDPVHGPWTHRAFVPAPLPDHTPALEPETYLHVGDARAALAALDSTARHLPNPTLLRRPTLQREAQSTSALEGTYAPLSDVLTADEDQPARSNMREILNYVGTANYAFESIQEGRPLTPSLLASLQDMLVRGTKDEGPETGLVRQSQVAVGRRPDATPGELPVHAARFIPSPPGPDLQANVQALTDWIRADRRREIDPVVAAAMAHYEFETLHPFHDGNGRIGRLLIVVQLHLHQVLSEPTLTVSPWFEARRTDYYDALLRVSTHGDWNSYVRFFATGIKESADLTHRQMLALVKVQSHLKDVVRDSPLRADTAHQLIDIAVARVSFSVRQAERELGVSYGRANKLVQQLVDLGVIDELPARSHARRFYAPDVLRVLTTIA